MSIIRTRVSCRSHTARRRRHPSCVGGVPQAAGRTATSAAGGAAQRRLPSAAAGPFTRGQRVKACKLASDMRARIARICVLFAMTLGTMLTARAADPQSYRVDLDSTGDGAMDATLHATSELLSLRDSAPVSPFGLIARARGEVERLKS